MQGFEVRFKVYAETQEEADTASAAIRGFIAEKAAKGIAVTGRKIAEAVSKWKDNVFVTNYFK